MNQHRQSFQHPGGQVTLLSKERDGAQLKTKETWSFELPLTDKLPAQPS